VRLVPGHSKDHRPDLNQVKGGLAVSADGGVPLLWEAQDGNRADVSTSVEYWLQLKEVVGRTDFLFVGDRKLASQDNLIAIMPQQGRFLAPLPGYAGIQAQLEHRLRKTQAFLEGLPKRLGKRALKSREAIEQAREATLHRYRTGGVMKKPKILGVFDH
jgi:hypothetical protein